MNAWRIDDLGDAALLLRLDDRIDADINRRVHACASTLRKQAPEWLIDITPAYASLALHIDTVRIVGACPAHADPLAAARAWTQDFLARLDDEAGDVDACIVRIPVAYGGAHGDDLAAVAARAGITADETVARHAAAEYTVAMIGFAPGFPYLLGLDPSLATPRLATPRKHVPAGSVGIGGAQTGIYPMEGPGGWRLIGRTPLRLFDATRDPPGLLRPGDRVRFVAIDDAAFDATSEHPR